MRTSLALTLAILAAAAVGSVLALSGSSCSLSCGYFNYGWGGCSASSIPNNDCCARNPLGPNGGGGCKLGWYYYYAGYQYGTCTAYQPNQCNTLPDAQGDYDGLCAPTICFYSWCGDGTCDATKENTCSCQADCPGTCSQPPPGTTCGNDRCDPGETYASCPSDCPSSCGDGTCTAAESSAGDCPQDCGTPFNCDAQPGTTWNPADQMCEAQTCGQSGTSGTDCNLLIPPGTGWYCTTPDNKCCPVGYKYSSGVCISTNECRDITDPANYCGTSANNFPTQLATFIPRNPQCIGSGSTLWKPAGMSACCSIPGGKYGSPTYYDWTDASGNNAGVVIY